MPKCFRSLQTGVYHHVTGIDASSSASLAAYVNTLTFSPLDKTHKVVSGIYWSGFLVLCSIYTHILTCAQLLQCILTPGHASGG